MFKDIIYQVPIFGLRYHTPGPYQLVQALVTFLRSSQGGTSLSLMSRTYDKIFKNVIYLVPIFGLRYQNTGSISVGIGIGNVLDRS